MIHLVVGRQGSGKTLLLVSKALQGYKKNKNVYANFKLNIPTKELTYKDIIECNLKNGLVFLDEVHLLLPSREWYKPHCKKICDGFLSQVRKQNLELWCSTQMLRKVDVRIREEADFIYECEKFVYQDGKWKQNNETDENIKDKPIVIKVLVKDVYSESFDTFFFHANSLYTKYDTSEIIKIKGIDEDE